MYELKIAAFDNYLSDMAVTNDNLSEFIDTSDQWIYSRTGIKERRISDGITTSGLCAETAKKLLNKSNIDAKDIDLIIVSTMSPDYLTPSSACLVQSLIGAENAFCFDINAACSGFVYALSVADKFIKSGTYKNAIVFGAETLSKLIDWNDRSTCVLFGDGAGGVLLTRGDKKCIIAEDLHSDGSLALSLTAGKMNLNNPFIEKKDIKDDFYVKMNGRDIFNFAVKNVPLSIKTVLEKSPFTIDDINWIVPHQANSRIVEFVAKKLNISMDKFYLNIDKYGNTSAASIPIALGEMSKKGLLKDGDKIIITGFGGGLTWGSILLEI